LALREEVEELVNNRLRCLGAGGRVGEALDHFSGMIINLETFLKAILPYVVVWSPFCSCIYFCSVMRH